MRPWGSRLLVDCRTDQHRAGCLDQSDTIGCRSVAFDGTNWHQGVGGHLLERLIGKMLENNPAQRPTAAEALSRLSETHRVVCEAHYNVTGVTA